MKTLRVLTQTEINELYSYLYGTCHTLDEGLETLFGFDSLSLSDESLEELANWIFLCGVCNWWYETGAEESDTETEGERTCINCGESDDNDE